MILYMVVVMFKLKNFENSFVHSFDSAGIDRAIMVAKVSLPAPVEKEHILIP